jgi:methylmalonyl-CoA mutase cobalamin-binding subunit
MQVVVKLRRLSIRLSEIYIKVEANHRGEDLSIVVGGQIPPEEYYPKTETGYAEYLISR